MLPLSLQRLLAESVMATSANDKAFLNVCFAYTSRAEMSAAVRDVVAASDAGLLLESDVCEDLLRSCFWSNESPDPDLVIRTSGESRLSDFLLWQSAYSVLAFVERLWPEFTIWDLFKAVFFYQRHEHETSAARTAYESRLASETVRSEARVARKEAVLRHVMQQRRRRLLTLAAEAAVECA